MVRVMLYPNAKFFEKLSKTNVKVVINSDCHEPKQLLIAIWI